MQPILQQVTWVKIFYEGIINVNAQCHLAPAAKMATNWNSDITFVPPCIRLRETVVTVPVTPVLNFIYIEFNETISTTTLIF